MEDYAAKMAGKTDAELRLYVDRRAEYREEAVLAALTELERRGHAVPEAAALRPELEAAAQLAASVPPPEAPAWARPRPEQETEAEEEAVAADAPALYTPITVSVYSLFNFVVGSVLMLMNLLRLRRYGGAALLLALMLLVVSVGSWVANQFKLLPLYAFLGVNFVLTILYVYVLWPYFIGQQDYRPRNGLTPFLVMMLIQFLLGMVYYAFVGGAPSGGGL